MLLLDTDVMIDVLRRFPPALAWLESQSGLYRCSHRTHGPTLRSTSAHVQPETLRRRLGIENDPALHSHRMSVVRIVSLSGKRESLQLAENVVRDV